jgi:uncharacterized membrane protein
MVAGEAAGVWVAAAGAALAVLTSFVLRTRIPAPAVAVLLVMSGAAIGWGGMLLQQDPPAAQTVFAVVALAVLVPFHVRVVVGPFGPPKAGGGPGPGR